MPSISSQSNSAIDTALSHPTYRRIVQIVWGLLLLVNVVLFVVGLAYYANSLRLGCLCIAFNLVDVKDGRVVLSPNPNGPAANLIQEGDFLLAVDGVPFDSDITPSQAIRPMDDFPANTPIRLTLQTGTDSPRDITLIRDPRYWQLQGAMRLGISFELAYAYHIGLELLSFGIAFGLGLLMVWRRPHSGMVLYAALSLVIASLVFGQPVNNLEDSLFVRSYFTLSSTVALAFGLLFPNGQFQPVWSRWLLVGYIIWSFFSNFISQSSLVSSAGLLIIALIYIAIVIFRYNRFMTPVQRQQVKWAAVGMCIVFITNVLFNLSVVILGDVLPFPVFTVYFTLGLSIKALLSLFMPLGFAFAMLRYRLYDVDLVINRGLVYGAVTFTLGGLFILIFLAIQTALGGLLGSAQAGIAIAISAAVTAFLFNPTRKRVQHLIDRRFYGFRFDLNELAQGQKMPEIKNRGLLTGQALGGYQLLGVLGRGGMGEVYQGEGQGKTVAIKILPPELADQAEFRKRFVREAETLAALNHPNIVKVYESGETDDIAYMVLEYIDGRELGAALKEQGVFSPQDAQALLNDITAALDYAHQRGLVHRDIKPSNIMLREVGGLMQAVLMDFGIAKIQDARTALTSTGAVGTIDYMAPEQILEAKTVDYRADIYALGVVLYEMLTGERPFKGGVGQVVFAHLQQPAPDPRSVRPDLPAEVSAAILKALAKNPTDRFQSAHDFADALIPKG